MEFKKVYAKISGIVRWSGGTTTIAAGVTTADDDHPLVIERPDLWTTDEPEAHLKTPREKPASRVENATAKPGQRRGYTRRG